MLLKLLEKLLCPSCAQGELLLSSACEYQPADSEYPTDLLCATCGRVYPVADGIVDFIGDKSRGFRLSQFFMELPLVAYVYERFSRPLATGLVSSLAWERRTVMELLELDAGLDVLDIACGPGNYTRPFAREIRDDNACGIVVGMDLSWPMLMQGRRELAKIPVSNISFIRADVTAWPLREKSFDRIHSSGALHLFPQLPRVFESIAASLKPGGAFVCSTYIKGDNALRRRLKEYSEPLSGFHWFDIKELKDMADGVGLVGWRHYIKREGIVFRVDRAV